MDTTTMLRYARDYARQAIEAQVEETATTEIGSLLDACEDGWRLSGLSGLDDGEIQDLRYACHDAWRDLCEQRSRALVLDAIEDHGEALDAEPAGRRGAIEAYDASCVECYASAAAADAWVVWYIDARRIR